eukprot:scaffold978_cov172-Ochromonas_danica.AAC.2
MFKRLLKQTDTDEAFLWQIALANGGDFVVLRTSGDDAYNPYIWGLAVASGRKLNSVTTILCNNTLASEEPEVLSRLQQAEAVFLAGGDQSTYLSYWMHTSIQRSLQDMILSNRVSLGGTSAGCMVLGRYIYTGQVGSVTSEEALAHPFNPLVTLQYTEPFLTIPWIGENFILDTHFVTRDRMGRLLTFMGRLLTVKDNSIKTVTAMGTDEHTALLVDAKTGMGKIVGQGTLYICYGDAKLAADAVVQPGQPLTLANIPCRRLDAKKHDTIYLGKLDISREFMGRSVGGVEYNNTVKAGQFLTAPYGP